MYLRLLYINNNQGEIKTQLICAKGKVASLKSLTITINNCFNWSDSQVTLAWIKNQSRVCHVFVSYRIAEIQTINNINNWYYNVLH
jgi:hypothetical protein